MAAALLTWPGSCQSISCVVGFCLRDPEALLVLFQAAATVKPRSARNVMRSSCGFFRPMVRSGLVWCAVLRPALSAYPAVGSWNIVESVLDIFSCPPSLLQFHLF